MQFHRPAPNCAQHSFMCKRRGSLGNTFINLHVPQQLARRSGSAPCSLSAPQHASVTRVLAVTVLERAALLRRAQRQGCTFATGQDKLTDDLAEKTSARADSRMNPPKARCDARSRTSSDFTTIIIRNLPVSADQAVVQTALTDAGLDGTYDYLYVPVRFNDGTCHGYGFINFTTAEIAAAFLKQWRGNRVFCHAWHRKPLAVDVASIQGRAALVARNSKQVARNPRFRTSEGRS